MLSPPSHVVRRHMAADTFVTRNIRFGACALLFTARPGKRAIDVAAADLLLVGRAVRLDS